MAATPVIGNTRFRIRQHWTINWCCGSLPNTQPYILGSQHIADYEETRVHSWVGGQVEVWVVQDSGMYDHRGMLLYIICHTSRLFHVIQYRERRQTG